MLYCSNCSIAFSQRIWRHFFQGNFQNEIFFQRIIFFPKELLRQREVLFTFAHLNNVDERKKNDESPKIFESYFILNIWSDISIKTVGVLLGLQIGRDLWRVILNVLLDMTWTTTLTIVICKGMLVTFSQWPFWGLNRSVIILK